MRHSTGKVYVSRTQIVICLALTLIAMMLLPIFGFGIYAYFFVYGTGL